MTSDNLLGRRGGLKLLLKREHIQRGGASALFLEETQAGFVRGRAARAWFQKQEPRSLFGSPPPHLRPDVITFGMRGEHAFGSMAERQAARILFAIETTQGVLGGSAYLDRQRYRGTSATFLMEFDLCQLEVAKQGLFEVHPRAGQAIRVAFDSARGLAAVQAAYECPSPEAITFLGGEPLIFADWLEERGWKDSAERIRAAR